MKRLPLAFVLLGVLLFALAVARLALGSSGVGFPTDSAILADRAGRLLAAVLVGSSLALSGVMLQALLSNPLADPYVLGLASGAGLGVALRRALGLAGLLGNAGLWAIGGAGAACVVVFAFGRRRGRAMLEGGIDPLAMVLAGVVVGLFCAAATLLVGQWMGPGARDEISRWMLGAIAPVVFAPSWSAWSVPAGVALATACALVGLVWRGPQLDGVTLPEMEVRSLGLPLAKLRLLLFGGGAVLAALAVLLAGPVAFVGLIAPHLARVCVGPRHRVLAPAAAICGAALVVLGDLSGSLFHLVTGQGVVPVGVFTALLGGPAFLWMLKRK